MQTTVEQPNSPARREFLRGVGGVFVAAALAPTATLGGDSQAFAFPIAVSDRAAGLRQQLPAFALARACGASAVEIDMGRLGAAPGMANRLLDADARQAFLAAAGANRITITSVALSAFEDQPFSSHPKAEEYADDLLYVLRQLNVAVGLLPVDADDAYRTGLAVERLKRLAPLAASHGLTLAIAARLAPIEFARLLDRVGSPAVRAAIVAETGDDALAAVNVLGATRVAQVRYRHDADADPSAGLARLTGTLAEAGWDGAFVIDRPAVAAGDIPAGVASAVRRLHGLRSRGLFAPTYS